MKNKRKIGNKLLRIGILIFCTVSFFNTAYGLKEYVFDEKDTYAYMISLVFQIVIAVGSIKFNEISTAYDEWKNRKKDESASKTESIRFEWPKLFDKRGFKTVKKILICIKRKVTLVTVPIILSFLMSVFFDFVFIVNTTYNITEDKENLAGITAKFVDIKREISLQITKYNNYYYKLTYDNIAQLFPLVKDSEQSILKDWKSIWEEEKKKYKRAPLDMSLIEVMRNLLQYENADLDDPGNNNYKEMTIPGDNLAERKKNIDAYINAYSSDDVNIYMLEICEAFEVFTPSELTPSQVDSLKELMNNIKTHFQAVIDLENANNNDTPNVEDKTPYAGNDTVFTDIRDMYDKEIKVLDEDISALEKREQQKDHDGLRMDPDNDASYDREAEEWDRSIRTRALRELPLLSQKHIQNCKNAIADIEKYEQYLNSIMASPEYNLAVLTSMISETGAIDTDIIDEITAKIAQSLFSDDGSAQGESESSGIEDKINKYKELKENLTYYIPLKNIDYYLGNMEFTSEAAAKAKEEEKNKGKKYKKDGEENNVAENGKEANSATDEKEAKDGEPVKAFDKGLAKTNLDNLIQNLATLSENMKDGDNKNFNGESVEIIIKRLIALEDEYINEKNNIVKAFNYFHPKDYDKMIEADSSVELKSKGLAVFAIIFAALVDVMSLLLGIIVQSWSVKNNSQGKVQDNQQSEG